MTHLADCDGQMDILFMIDSSGSIRRQRFEDYFKTFIHDIIDNLEISPNKTRVGLVTFSDDAEIVANLNTYQSRETLLQAVDNIEYKAGRTNTAAALRAAYEQIFIEANGDRFAVPNFGILLTDGQSTVDPDQTLPEAIEARVNGIHLIVVGAEMKMKSLEVKGIASDPDEENIFVVEKFSDLSDVAAQVVAATCDGRKMSY